MNERGIISPKPFLNIDPKLVVFASLRASMVHASDSADIMMLHTTMTTIPVRTNIERKTGVAAACPAGDEPKFEIIATKMRIRTIIKINRKLKKPEIKVKRASLPKRLTKSSQLCIKRLPILGNLVAVVGTFAVGSVLSIPLFIMRAFSFFVNGRNKQYNVGKRK